MSVKLSDIKNEFSKFLIIKDPYVIDVVLATLVANLLISKDPVWTLLVANSSGGKSTLLAPSAAISNIYFIDDITSKTFLSGYAVGKQEVSLLKIMGSGVMVFSDFSTVLAKDSITRGEILSQFRCIYDRNFVKRTGKGEIRWGDKGEKLGMLAASTPDIYFQLESARSMGERFCFYSISQPTNEEIVKKQEEVNLSSKKITEELKPFYAEYFAGVRDFIATHLLQDLKMTPEQIEKVHRAAIFCVRGKTSVHTDFKTGRPDNLANTPGVGRDRKVFNVLLHALQTMYAYETDDKNACVQDGHIKIIEKVAWSSVNRERRKILEILAVTDKPITSSAIGATGDFGLNREAIEKHILPLFSVGLIKAQKLKKPYTWFLNEENGIKEFVKSLTEKEVGEIGSDEEDEKESEFEAWR